MEKEEAKERIEKLKKVISRHRYLEHVLDKQEISAAALDSLKKELFDLEQQYPEFVTPDSPTQRVAGKPLEKFKKVQHPQMMLSFNDGFNQQDMRAWLERMGRLLTEKERQQIDFYVEPKFDGLAIELVYKDGLLETGSTRGDGRVGEDVTQNIKTIEAIPLRLSASDRPGAPDRDIVIRGEVFVNKKEFSRINQEQKKKGLAAFANPRNMAAGSVRQLDPKITASRKLDFYAYDIYTTPEVKPYGLTSGVSPVTHQQKHALLKELGFKTDPRCRRLKNLEEVFAFHQQLLKQRAQLPYEIDGLVVQINDNEIFAKLGVAGKAPRAAIAFKFPLKQAATVVEDIIVQVGRTGALTPVAVLKPVEVGGTTISRATLHNEEEIKRLDVRVGDTVIVGRAGDVIPDIIRVLSDLRTGREKRFRMPENCPACASPLAKPQGQALWRCPNSRCQIRRKRQIYHFVSRPAFDIEGLGPKIVDQLLEQGLISDAADLFALKQGDLMPLPRFGQKSAANLVKAIESKREIPLARFIFALGIRNVGEETAQDLADHFNSLSKLQQAPLERLEAIEDIGPVVAQSIYHWFRDKNNLNFLKKLLAHIKIHCKSQITNHKLENKTFVLTGVLRSMTRPQAKERIRALAGDVSESVQKSTDFVVVGQDPGSKYERAKKLGVKTINEEEFLRLIAPQ